jgi:hypothetical protein
VTPGLVPLLRFVLLGIAAILVTFRDDPALRGRRFGVLLAFLALPAILVHMELAPLRPGVTLVHWSEFYHYYLGTKYFAELGYGGLYDATVIADHEDDPGSWQPGLPVRSLATYALGTRGEVLERADAIRAAFTPERWGAFRADASVFRASAPEDWRNGTYQQDHGYNGTPLVTLILGTIARQGLLDTQDFVRLAAWFDPALVILAAVALGLVAGLEWGALFLFLWAANPFNDYIMIGRSYLRYLHLFALMALAVAHHRRRKALAGTALAAATCLRIFPALAYCGALAQNVLSPGRRALLREQRRFHAAFLLALLLLLLVSGFQASPDGRNPWIAHVEKLGLHARQLSYNVISLQYLFFYGSDHNAAAILRAFQEGRSLNWVTEAGKALEAHGTPYRFTLLALCAALALLLRRGTQADGYFAGLAMTFAALHLSHYDYFVLAVVPFLFPGRRDVLVALILFWMAATLSIFLPAAAASLDTPYFILSLLTALWFAVTLGLRAFRPGAVAVSASDALV